MNSSSFFKKTSVRVAGSILLFLIFVGVLSYAVYIPYVRPFANSNHYDMAFVGASSFRRGVNPSLVDNVTGQSSYVYAGTGIPLYGRSRMLECALENEDLQTVVLEVSYWSLIRPNDDYTLDRRLLYFSKLQGIGPMAEAALEDFSFMEDEYDQLYGQLLFDGIDTWRDIFRGTYGDYVAARGYAGYRVADQEIKTAEEARQLYNSEALNTDFPREILEDLEQMIRLCQDRGVQVILITMPLTQSYVWKVTGLDEYRITMESIAQKYGVPYYDFNLLENIGSYLIDSGSYHDFEHLSKKGAKPFSRILGEVIRSELEGTPCKYGFYDTYETAKKYSVYQTY